MSEFDKQYVWDEWRNVFGLIKNHQGAEPSPVGPMAVRQIDSRSGKDQGAVEVRVSEASHGRAGTRTSLGQDSTIPVTECYYTILIVLVVHRMISLSTGSLIPQT